MDPSMERNLLFKDQYIEKEFKSSQLRIHQKCFLILTVALVLQTLGIYFSNPLDINIFETRIILIFLFGTASTISGYVLIIKKFPTHSDKAISLYVFCFIMCAAEFIHIIQNTMNLGTWVYFLLGVNIQTGCVFLLISQIRWTQSLSIISIVHIYSWFRVIDLLNTTGAQKTASISLAIHILLFFTLTYTNEKELRLCFQKIRSDSQQMSSLDEIMKNVLDSPIIIMKEDDVVFFNNATQKMFEVRSKGEIEHALNSIQIIFNEGSNQSPSKNPQTTDHRLEDDSKLYNLYQFYKGMELKCKSPCKKLDTTFQHLEGEALTTVEGDKQVKCFSIHIGAIHWKGAISIILIINDITFIRNHFKTLDSYKDNLLATVSHDLRTPLNGIMGMLESLSEEIIEQKHKDILHVSITSAKLLLNMINDILDFSLISKGKLRLIFESTNIKELVEETVNIMALQARTKGLNLIIENSLPEDQHYLVDGNRLRQVLLNLIGNAIKYTTEGHVKLRVFEKTTKKNKLNMINTDKNFENDEIIEIPVYNSESNSEKINSLSLNEKSFASSSMNFEKTRIIFEVEDTGIGIKPDDVKKLFKLFSRATSGHDNNMNGIGLGLAISQSLVVLMNNNRNCGRIKVASEYGKGSRFRFPIYIDNEVSQAFQEFDENSMKLPPFKEQKHVNLAAIDECKLKFSVDSEADEFLDTKKKFVLVVDDDPINILVASNYLNSLKDEYSFVTAENGKEALDKVKSFALKKEFFDIILMDCNMPVMDGYEASYKLKIMMKENFIPWAPIVAITANVASTDKDKCYAFGMDFHITKPYTKTILKTMLENATCIGRTIFNK